MTYERWDIFQFLYYADKIEEQQQHQNFPDESAIESTSNTGIGRNLIVEDDLKSPYLVDSPVC
jgi:CCR4-NOT transcription complex subunit 3